MVEALGTISLALVPNGLPAGDIADCKAAIKCGGRRLRSALVDGQGYRVPFKPGKKGFPWGSNSFVLNNALVIALAYDFTGEAKYLDAVAEGMNYILGRNPLNQSYITGFGERPLKNPHHRFWAHQANAKFPSAPAGASRAARTRAAGSRTSRPPASRAAPRRSASSTTSRPGRSTRSQSTGTPRWRGWRRSSTRRVRPRRAAAAKAARRSSDERGRERFAPRARVRANATADGRALRAARAGDLDRRAGAARRPPRATCRRAGAARRPRGRPGQTGGRCAPPAAGTEGRALRAARGAFRRRAARLCAAEHRAARSQVVHRTELFAARRLQQFSKRQPTRRKKPRAVRNLGASEAVLCRT